MAGDDLPQVNSVFILEFGYDHKKKTAMVAMKGQHPAASAGAGGAEISPQIQCTISGRKVTFSLSFEATLKIGDEDLTFDIEELGDELKAILGLKTSKPTPRVPWAMPTPEQLRRSDGTWMSHSDYARQQNLKKTTAAAGGKWGKSFWPMLAPPVYAGLIRYYHLREMTKYGPLYL